MEDLCSSVSAGVTEGIQDLKVSVNPDSSFTLVLFFSAKFGDWSSFSFLLHLGQLRGGVLTDL